MAELKQVDENQIQRLAGLPVQRFDRAQSWIQRTDEVLGAGAGLFLARELEHVMAEVLTVDIAPRSYAQCFRVSTEIPDGAATYNQRYEEDFGESAWVSGRSMGDVPRVGTKRDEQPFPIRMMAVAIEYTMEELQHAAFAGVPLDRSYQRAARIADDTRHNSVAWNGDETVGLKGLFTSTGIQRSVSASLAVTTANADAWITRLGEPIIKLIADTKGLISSVRVVMSPRLRTKLMATRASNASDTTIYQFWLNTMGSRIESVIEAHEMEGVAGKDFIAYYPSDTISYEAPRLLTPLPPQIQGLNTIIYLTSKTGGLYVRRPKHCMLVEMPSIAAAA